MTITCTARYQQGVLRPNEPLDLDEGAEVDVVVMPKKAAEALSGEALADAIRRIAALPLEGKSDPFSGRDHDQLLYGGQS